jgi:hypothetical protein
VETRSRKVPDITLRLAQTAKRLGQGGPVSLFCGAAHSFNEDRSRIRDSVFSSRLVAARKQLLESLAHVPLA